MYLCNMRRGKARKNNHLCFWVINSVDHRYDILKKRIKELKNDTV